MLIGCHGSVWSGSSDLAGLSVAISQTRDAGFDLIEIPLMDPDDLDVPATRALLADHELVATASLGLKPELDLASPEEVVSRRGEVFLGRALEVVSEIGGTHLCGVTASAMTKYSAPLTPAGRTNSVEASRRLGERGAALGVKLCLEVVNRYETNLFNTADQGLDFLADVGSPNVALHLDSYHMNIEEQDYRTPLLAAGANLGYAHVGESHRGYLGTGTVDFPEFFSGLVEAEYDGPVVFESFSSAVVHPDLSTMLAIWRNLWSDSADLGAKANTFIREGIAATEARLIS